MEPALTTDRPSQPSTVIGPHLWAERAGTLGLLCFGLGMVAGPDLIPLGQALMLIGLVMVLPRIWRPLLQDGLFRLSLVFALFICLYTLYLYLGPAPPPTDHTEGLDQFLRTGFFSTVLIAIWWAKLVEQGKATWPIWAFVAGFYIRLATQWPQEDWSQGIPTKIGFGLYYNPFSMFCALVMAWWLVVAFNLKASARRRALLFAAIAVAFSPPLLGWLYSLSRGGMLAFLVAVPFILYLQFRGRRASKKQLGRAAVLIITLIVAGLLWLGGPMLDRFAKEQKDVSTFLEQGSENYAPTRISSIGTRFVIWREAIDLWLEKPVLGHGPGPTKYFIDPLIERFVIDDSTDFENTYLEILVRLGLTGAMFYLFHLWLCLRSFGNGQRTSWYPTASAQFLAAALLIFAVALLFREGLLDPRGRNFASYLLAGLYAFHATRIWATAYPPVTAVSAEAPAERPDQDRHDRPSSGLN